MPVFHVESVQCSPSTTSVPSDVKDDVRGTGPLKATQEVNDLLGFLWRHKLVTDLLAFAHLRDENLVANAFLNGFIRFTPPNEHAKGPKVLLKRYRVYVTFRDAPVLELLAFSASQVVHVV